MAYLKAMTLRNLNQLGWGEIVGNPLDIPQRGKAHGLGDAVASAVELDAGVFNRVRHFDSPQSERLNDAVRNGSPDRIAQ